MKAKSNSNPIFSYISDNVLHPRVVKFALVGGSGVVVNMGMIYLLTDIFKIYYVISSVFAIELSILSNFFLNNLWTWKDRKKKRLSYRLMQYHISVGITAVLANWLLLVFLTEVLGFYYLISNLIGIGVGTIFNYVVNDLWTFRHQT